MNIINQLTNIFDKEYITAYMFMDALRSQRDNVNLENEIERFLDYWKSNLKEIDGTIYELDGFENKDESITEVISNLRDRINFCLGIK